MRGCFFLCTLILAGCLPSGSGADGAGSDVNKLRTTNAETGRRVFLWSVPLSATQRDQHCWYFRKEKALDEQLRAEYNKKWNKNVSMDQFLMISSAQLTKHFLPDEKLARTLASDFDAAKKDAMLQGTWTVAACGGTMVAAIAAIAAGGPIGAVAAAGLITGTSACFGNHIQQQRRAEAIDAVVTAQRAQSKADAGEQWYRLDEVSMDMIASAVQRTTDEEVGPACKKSDQIFR